MNVTNSWQFNVEFKQNFRNLIPVTNVIRMLTVSVRVTVTRHANASPDGSETVLFAKNTTLVINVLTTQNALLENASVRTTDITTKIMTVKTRMSAN